MRINYQTLAAFAIRKLGGRIEIDFADLERLNNAGHADVLMTVESTGSKLIVQVHNARILDVTADVTPPQQLLSDPNRKDKP